MNRSECSELLNRSEFCALKGEVRLNGEDLTLLIWQLGAAFLREREPESDEWKDKRERMVNEENKRSRLTDEKRPVFPAEIGDYQRSTGFSHSLNNESLRKSRACPNSVASDSERDY